MTLDDAIGQMRAQIEQSIRDSATRMWQSNAKPEEIVFFYHAAMGELDATLERLPQTIADALARANAE
jgi:hypothetical protein